MPISTEKSVCQIHGAGVPSPSQSLKKKDPKEKLDFNDPAFETIQPWIAIGGRFLLPMN